MTKILSRPVDWVASGLLIAGFAAATWAFSWSAVRPWFYMTWAASFLVPPVLGLRSPYTDKVDSLKERPNHFFALTLLGILLFALGCFEAWSYLAH